MRSLQSIKLDVCASPVPPGPESAEALDRYKDKLGAFASSPDGTGLLWKPVPDRFAVRCGSLDQTPVYVSIGCISKAEGSKHPASTHLPSRNLLLLTVL